MALTLKDRVLETCTSPGTGSVTLLGAVTGYQAFSTGVGNGNTCYYTIADQGGPNWEVGIGTYNSSGNTLARTTPLSGSSTTPVDFSSGSQNVFVTYPSEKSVNLDASGNVSPLGTIASGTWQGTTVGVAYGGTGVTASSGANSVVLRDSNQNITANRVTQNLTVTTSAAGTTVLTLASSFFQVLTGTTTQTYQLPDATSVPLGTTYIFDNDSTGNLFVVNAASGAIDTVPPGGYAAVFLEQAGTVAGIWGRYGFIPSEVNWGTNSLDLGGSTIITNGVWQGTTVASGYGGTGLTTFTGANNALYSTSSSALTAGTLPIAAGGTGNTSGQAASVANALTIGTGLSGTSSTYNGSSAVTISNAGVTSIAGTSPVNMSASTGSVTASLASGYGDTQNPYGSKTANYVLAGPTTGASAAPTFRALVAADIPSTYSQFASGTAILFQQTTAPTGWTKVTTYDNAALRIVSGTVGSGGSVNFTTAFASQSVTGSNAGYALTTTDIPAHNHGISDPGHAHSVYDPGHSHGQNVGYTCNNNHVHCGVGGGAAENPNPLNGPGSGGANTFGSGTGIGIYGATTGISTTNTGSGGSHTHTFTGTAINLAVKYVDAIICTKN